MISKHGAELMNQDARVSFGQTLLPRAALVTPNLSEAAHLAGMEVATVEDMKEAARRIADLGPGAVLVKGGHLEGDPVDILYHRSRFTELWTPRVETRHTHGTGCTYSAAITALLARGEALETAVAQAKAFITNAIGGAPGLGAGAGPLNHWASL
jgi:hydroxymethylpyrimidine/phosphomethylpyrimidine kinase